MLLIRRRRWLQHLAALALAVALPRAHAFGSAPTWPELKARIRRENPSVPQLSVADLATWLADPKRPRPLLIDVRPLEEFADGHLDGALRAETVDEAMPLLQKRAPGQIAVLYCSVGYRSSELASKLIAHGVARIYDLEGSIFEWANDGYPVIATNGVKNKVHPYDRKWGTLLHRELWSREP
jgi:rhodanese-related sulfurtransferase